jgi:hypothetical protein
LNFRAVFEAAEELLRKVKKNLRRLLRKIKKNLELTALASQQSSLVLSQ